MWILAKPGEESENSWAKLPLVVRGGSLVAIRTLSLWNIAGKMWKKAEGCTRAWIGLPVSSPSAHVGGGGAGRVALGIGGSRLLSLRVFITSINRIISPDTCSICSADKSILKSFQPLARS